MPKRACVAYVTEPNEINNKKITKQWLAQPDKTKNNIFKLKQKEKNLRPKKSEIVDAEERQSMNE